MFGPLQAVALAVAQIFTEAQRLVFAAVLALSPCNYQVHIILDVGLFMVSVAYT